MATEQTVEQELVALTKIKPSKYDDRQDFLAAIVKALSKVEDDDFDALSDAAADWNNKQAVPAVSKKKPIPDFPDVEGAEDEAPEEDAEATDDAETAEDDDAEEGDPTDDNPESDDPDEQDHAAEAEAESDNEAEEAAEDAKPAKKGKTKPAPAKAKGKPAPEKPKGKVKAKVEDDEEAEEKPAKKPKETRNYSELSGERDRFGCILGTKTADAVAMYVKGTTAKAITEKLDGRYYNILGKLQKDGHLVEKLEGGVWRLTHKDDVKSNPKAKAKAKGK